MIIRSKAEFYRLWHAGLLGNKPRTWANLAQLFASGYPGPVGIRTVGVSGGKVRYRVPLEEVAAVVHTWPGTPTFSEPMPDHLRLIQGEVMNGTNGLELTYSLANDGTGLPMMREAMRRPERATGIVAAVLLTHYLWPASLEEIRRLLEDYPDSVIEFGAHDCAVGELPRRNTVIWEVRNY